jgi:hypothetical protein
MKSLIRLVMLMLLLVGWSLAALSLHVMIVPGDIPIALITKSQMGFTDTYVDTRQWTPDDLPQHKALVDRLIGAGREKVLEHVIDGPQSLGERLSTAANKEPHDRNAESRERNARYSNEKSGTSHQAAKLIASWF